MLYPRQPCHNLQCLYNRHPLQLYGCNLRAENKTRVNDINLAALMVKYYYNSATKTKLQVLDIYDWKTITTQCVLQRADWKMTKKNIKGFERSCGGTSGKKYLYEIPVPYYNHIFNTCRANFSPKSLQHKGIPSLSKICQNIFKNTTCIDIQEGHARRQNGVTVHCACSRAGID